MRQNLVYFSHRESQFKEVQIFTEKDYFMLAMAQSYLQALHHMACLFLLGG